MVALNAERYSAAAIVRAIGRFWRAVAPASEHQELDDLLLDEVLGGLSRKLPPHIIAL